ncbi:hypothetical protein NDA13_006290 [Ustilago tritici]|nr:hypothetical protein NDA13_006290 [Ustilago tritici]
MFKRSTGQSLVPLVRDLEPGPVNNLLRMLTGKLAESVQFFGGYVLIVLTRQIFVDVPTHLLTTFLTREHHRKHVVAPLKWGEQQRRPSRSSTADASEARDFRARSGSMSHHSHDISPRPIIEDDEDEQEHGHSRYDSKATSDDENPPTPPILNSTYPPQRLQTARTSISITNDAASNRSPSCSMALPPTHFIPLLLRGFTTTFAHLHRTMVMVSLVVSALCILVASLSTNIAMLIAFQGGFFGTTSGVLLTPVVLYLPQWFDKRRGFATSVIFMGSSVGGVVFPLVFNALLTSVGFAWTMRAWSLAQIVLSGNLRPLLSPIALIYLLVVALQAFGWYIVSLYIATYATALDFNSTLSTGILCPCLNQAWLL